jgi:hypothetical protein
VKNHYSEIPGGSEGVAIGLEGVEEVEKEVEGGGG